MAFHPDSSSVLLYGKSFVIPREEYEGINHDKSSPYTGEYKTR